MGTDYVHRCIHLSNVLYEKGNLATLQPCNLVFPQPKRQSGSSLSEGCMITQAFFGSVSSSKGDFGPKAFS